MADLYVPYYNGKPNPKFDRDSAVGYLVYSIYVDKDAESDIWIGRTFEYDKTNDTSKAVAERFKGLQKYFEQYHTRPCRAEFEIRTVNQFPYKNNAQKKKRIYIETLNQQTTSVFLGIFLKAAEVFQRQEFSEEWQVICATGDVDYDEKNGTLKLVSVVDIKKKYNGEFLTEANKGENKEKKYLFLYISNDENEKKRVPEGENLGKNGNITVKCFPPGDSLQDVMKYLLKPFDYNYDLTNLNWKDKEVPRLINEMINATVKEARYKYIPAGNFYKLEESAFNHKDWPGFFIHGIGGSGKTTTTLMLVRHLVWFGKIYAPVWVKINREEMRKKMKEKHEMEFNININKEERDVIREYIFSKINELKNVNEINKNYLVIIDNLELPINDIKYVMEAVYNIFPQKATRPQLIITSRNICIDFEDINKELNLQLEKPPQLNEELFPDFISGIAEKMGGVYSEKISDAKKDGTFNKLARILHKTRGENLESVIASLGPLQYPNMNVAKLIDRTGKCHTETETYKMIFSFLKKEEKQALYLFYGNEDSGLISLDDISERIKNSGHWKKTPAKRQLEEILLVLLNNNLIYAEMEDKTCLYGIKSAPYFTILFEKEFLGEQEESGEFLRDIFIDMGWQLEKALEYDQGSKIIEPLLQKMKAKNREITKEHLFTAAQYSKDPEILSLLIKAGCDINARDGYGLNVCYYAIRGNNYEILNWLFNNFKEKMEPEANKDYQGGTAFHWAALAGNVDILNWLYTKFGNKRELLQSEDKFGITVFHLAAGNDSDAVLNWLYNELKEIKPFESKDNFGGTVFHWAARSNTADALNWLDEKFGYKLEPFQSKDKLGQTVFHRAAKYGNDITLDWLYKKFEEKIEPLQSTDNNGKTVFHLAAMSGNIVTLNWLYKKFKEKTEPLQIQSTDNFGRTVFHHAAGNDNIAALIWLYDKIENNTELLQRIDKLGRTVFHMAAKNGNIDMLDWLFDKFDNKNKRELLQYKDNLGRTYFHHAAKNGNAVMLEWLYEKYEKEIKPLQSIDDYGIDDYGRTILHHAVSGNSIVVLNLIYDKFKNKTELLQRTDNFGRTVFHFAVWYGNAATLNWVDEKYGYKKEPLLSADKVGRTVFHHAARGNNDAALDWLYEKFGNKLKPFLGKDKIGGTVFHWAAGTGNFATLYWLYEKLGVKIEELRSQDISEKKLFHRNVEHSNAITLDWNHENVGEKIKPLQSKDNSGKTVTHHTSRSNNFVALRWLDKKFNREIKPFESKDDIGGTVFHWAAGNGDAVTLNWLYEKFGNKPEPLQSKDKDGLTVYHWAVKCDNVTTLNWLLENIGKELLNCVDNDGKTAFDYAKENKAPTVLKWFDEKAPELVNS